MGKFLTAIVFLIALSDGAAGHDIWISQQGARNKATGEWCCGAGDCFVTDKLREIEGGYLDPKGEFIPFSETQPSPDGAFWICRRPDGTRRCVFVPPPNS